jgi:hypothetical protein
VLNQTVGKGDMMAHHPRAAVPIEEEDGAALTEVEVTKRSRTGKSGKREVLVRSCTTLQTASSSKFETLKDFATGGLNYKSCSSTRQASKR